MRKVEDRDICLFCRVRLIKQSKLNNIFSGLSQKDKCKLWQAECAETLSNLLLGTNTHPLKEYFISTAFCFKCTKIVIDMHFTWSQLTALENRINGYLKHVKSLFRKNFKEIPHSSIFGKGIMSQLNWSNFNPGRGYSYDQVIQLFMSVMEPEVSTEGETENSYYPLNIMEVEYKNEIASMSEADREALLNFEDNQLFPMYHDIPDNEFESGNAEGTDNVTSSGKLIGHVAGKGNESKYREEECSDSGSSFIAISSSSSESEYSSSDTDRRGKRVYKKYTHNPSYQNQAISTGQNVVPETINIKQQLSAKLLPRPALLPKINIGVSSAALAGSHTSAPSSSTNVSSSLSNVNLLSKTKVVEASNPIESVEPDTSLHTTGISSETKNNIREPPVKTNDLKHNIDTGSGSEAACLPKNDSPEDEPVEFATSDVHIKATVPRRSSAEVVKIGIGLNSKKGLVLIPQINFKTTPKSNYPQQESDLAKLGTSVTTRIMSNNVGSLQNFDNPKDQHNSSKCMQQFTSQHTSKKRGHARRSSPSNSRKKQRRNKLSRKGLMLNTDIGCESSDSILSCSSFSVDSSSDSDSHSAIPASKHRSKNIFKRRRNNSSSSSVVVIDSD